MAKEELTSPKTFDFAIKTLYTQIPQRNEYTICKWINLTSLVSLYYLYLSLTLVVVIQCKILYYIFSSSWLDL